MPTRVCLLYLLFYYRPDENGSFPNVKNDLLYNPGQVLDPSLNNSRKECRFWDRVQQRVEACEMGEKQNLVVLDFDWTVTSYFLPLLQFRS